MTSRYDSKQSSDANFDVGRFSSFEFNQFVQRFDRSAPEQYRQLTQYVDQLNDDSTPEFQNIIRQNPKIRPSLIAGLIDKNHENIKEILGSLDIPEALCKQLAQVSEVTSERERILRLGQLVRVQIMDRDLPAGTVYKDEGETERIASDQNTGLDFGGDLLRELSLAIHDDGSVNVEAIENALSRQTVTAETREALVEDLSKALADQDLAEPSYPYFQQMAMSSSDPVVQDFATEVLMAFADQPQRTETILSDETQLSDALSNTDLTVENILDDMLSQPESPSISSPWSKQFSCTQDLAASFIDLLLPD
jgi:hypothetical protein